MIGWMLIAAGVASSPELGKAEGRCRPNEQGPAYLLSVTGLKDRTGNLKLELYPSNNADFLQDDNILINAGKAFARVEVPVPASDPVNLCIRAPRPGNYSLVLMHDRDANRKFGLSIDGIAFPGDPRMCWGRPKAEKARAAVGSTPVRLSVTMQYRRSLVCFGPLKK